MANRRERRAAAAHVGRGQTLPALGKRWKVSRLTRGILARFTDEYARTVIRDPADVANDLLAKLPERFHDRIVDACIHDAGLHLTFDSPKVQELMVEPGGASYLLYLCLLPHYPEMTPDRAWEVFLGAGEAAVNRALKKAAGLAADPKGPAGSPASRPASPPTPSAAPTGATSTPTCSETTG